MAFWRSSRNIIWWKTAAPRTGAVPEWHSPNTEQIRNKRPGWKETELKQQLTQSAYKSEHNYQCEPEPWKASKAERSQSRT
jgi:hypothetical protein